MQLSTPSKDRNKSQDHLEEQEPREPGQTAGSPIKKRLSTKTIIKLWVAGLVIVALIGYLIWDIAATGPLMRLLTNRDELIAHVKSWGIFAPLLYILLQIVQTVVAPIPGQVVGSIGGFIFGAWGVLWTSIGTVLGCYIVFKISKRFGRPFLEKIFKKSAIERFDFIINSKSASLVLFLIYLLPGFPDDLICYLAGLTTLPVRRLMLILILGRLPVIIVTNYLGAGLTTNLSGVIAISIIAVILLGIGIWQHERILGALKKHSEHSSEDKDKKS